MDRFMLKVVLGYPKKEEEQKIIRINIAQEFPKVNRILHPDDILKARNLVKEVYMDEKIEKYIVDLVYATRQPEEYNLAKYKELISFGCFPLASINLALESKAYEFIKRIGYVIRVVVPAVAYDVMRNRISLTYEAEAENITSEDLIREILNSVEVP